MCGGDGLEFEYPVPPAAMPGHTRRVGDPLGTIAPTTNASRRRLGLTLAAAILALVATLILTNREGHFTTGPGRLLVVSFAPVSIDTHEPYGHAATMRLWHCLEADAAVRSAGFPA